MRRWRAARRWPALSLLGSRELDLLRAHGDRRARTALQVLGAIDEHVDEAVGRNLERHRRARAVRLEEERVVAARRELEALVHLEQLVAVPPAPAVADVRAHHHVALDLV